MRIDTRTEGAELRRRIAGRPLRERVHLAARLSSVPWDRVLAAFEPEGDLLDVGCGPGLLAHLLERAGFRGTYRGIDVDPRKIDRARATPGERPGRRFDVLPLEEAPPGAFDQVALLDVLYLVPRAGRAGFVARAAGCLKPGGRLVALTSGGGPSWKRALDRLQERVAVFALRMTAGAAVETCDGAEVAALMTEAGLADVEVRGIGAGYLHGFELVSGRRGAAGAVP